MKLVLLRLTALLFASTTTVAIAENLDAHQRLALEIFKELVETDTTHSTGDTGIAADLMAKRLIAAGFPKQDVRVIRNGDRKGNLIARYRSKNPIRGPILLLAHIDVVEANPEDWTKDPFTFLIEGDHYYGRGTLDDKDEAAIHIANLIRMKHENYSPDRDIIVALTADEEGGDFNGVQYLLANHRDLVESDFVINEGGGGIIQNGVHQINAIQAAEKVYQSFTLEVTNPGGHSSRPTPDNAIYQLAHGLTNIEGHTFPVELNEITRAFFTASAINSTPEEVKLIEGLLADPPEQASIKHFEQTPSFNALLRTTCVATQLLGGHAENALPQRASATVNCRVLPGNSPIEVQNTLVQIIADPDVTVTPIKPATPSDPSPLTAEVMTAVTGVTESMWPEAIVLPSMSTGATDGLYFRNAGIPVYGVSGIFRDAGESRAHGRDERILKRSFHEGVIFLDRLVRTLTSQADKPEPATPL
tara:strand:+ start:6870 stop:8294 length:1425 start_codon:yes stop_codon:yes gene_type:complete